MFKSLSERLGSSLDKLKGQGRLSEDNIKGALRDVRMALLEADVALPVVKQFIARIQEEALGEKIRTSLTPGQTFISMVKKELEHTLGEKNESLNLSAQPPVVILTAGLQGSGKTTTTAKLAKFLKERHNKKVMVVSADVYRPAAIKQLQTLAESLNIHFCPSSVQEHPLEIANKALQQAKQQVCDVLIVDTAGRLHIDDEMMDEIKALYQAINPTETLFVVDSMTGQDAAKTARAFNEALTLTGIILTKTDGDARGGAALSIREITGKPIKFIGMGEKTDALEPFHPDRIASRILGMGDVLSLIEEVEQKVDKKEAKELVNKLKKGKSFTLEDFKVQLQQMKKVGGIGSMLDKLPGMGSVTASIQGKINDKSFIQMEAIINSMTALERRKPELIKSSRKLRIANGSGTQVQDVNRLLKQFIDMQKIMKKVSEKGGLGKVLGTMRSMKNIQNVQQILPPGKGGKFR